MYMDAIDHTPKVFSVIRCNFSRCTRISFPLWPIPMILKSANTKSKLNHAKPDQMKPGNLCLLNDYAIYKSAWKVCVLSAELWYKSPRWNYLILWNRGWDPDSPYRPSFWWRTPNIRHARLRNHFFCRMQFTVCILSELSDQSGISYFSNTNIYTSRTRGKDAWTSEKGGSQH